MGLVGIASTQRQTACSPPDELMKTFKLRAEDRFWDELERLAKISGITPAEVIDRAIGLYSVALAEVEQGKTIEFILPKEQADDC